ncbi:MAG TPA: ABC transporter permease [Gemmatimonadaceae bacterium]|nr:ABC transporter permease [Gemmatimonadaceae bacterium]
MRALRFLIRKEFLQIFRDRTIVTMLFVMPLAQMLILANAATFEVKSSRLYVVDRDHTPMSRGVVQRLEASGRFVLAASSQSLSVADEAMLDRDVNAILVIPHGFERDIVRERSAPVQLVLDAEDGAAAAVTQAYASQILAAYSTELGAEVSPAFAVASARLEPPPRRGSGMIEVRQRGWYNAELEYTDFMVPGILVVLVTMVGTLLTAMNIVREKESGTLDQLNVTPVTRSTFIAAKLIPLWSLALLDLAIGLLLAWIVFQVPMRGSLVIVFFAAGVYLVAALGIGLWVSTVAETQQQAMFVNFAIMLIYILMSGIFTPVSGMPRWAQWIADASPITHFVRLMREVLLKGAGLADVAGEIGILAVTGALVLTLAVRQYRKRSA